MLSASRSKREKPIVPDFQMYIWTLRDERNRTITVLAYDLDAALRASNFSMNRLTMIEKKRSDYYFIETIKHYEQHDNSHMEINFYDKDTA